MRNYLIIIWLVICTGSYAAITPEWHTGAVVLQNQQVLTGELSVNLYYDLLLLRRENAITVLPVHKVASFHFYDEGVNINRRFVSVSNSDGSVPVFRLYEVVAPGDVLVIRKPKRPGTSNVEDIDFDYFMLHGAKVLPLRRFRGKLYPKLLEYDRMSMLAYMHENKLNPNKAADAIQLIGFYNYLTRTPSYVRLHQ